MKRLFASTLAVTLLSAVPASAQGYEDDIVVSGRHGSLRDAPSLSQAVRYDDLDIYSWEGREELRYRIRQTARHLCDRLGENDASSPVIPSCRDAAARDAMRRVGTYDAGYAPDDTVWLEPGPWDAPSYSRYDDDPYRDRRYDYAPYP